MASILDQQYEQVPLDKLTPHPANPRKGNVEAIGNSLADNGFYGALVVQRSTGHILAGNHRWLAARASGLEHVPVVWLDVDDDAALRILLADNRANDLATWDESALLDLLDELAVTPQALAGTGYDYAQLDDLRVKLGDEFTLDPQPTDADYAETQGEEDERTGRRGNVPSIHQAGLREVILVYPASQHTEVVELLTMLRRSLGGDTDIPTSDVVLAALRLAVPRVDQLHACLPDQTP